MDWATFYQRYEVWIVGVIFLLLGIPASIIGNRIDDYLKYRSLTAKGRKIQSILNYYRAVIRDDLETELRVWRKRNDPNYKPKNKLDDFDMLGLLILAIMVVGISTISLVEKVYGEKIAGGFFLVVSFSLYPFYIFRIMGLYNSFRISRDVSRLEKYREKTKAKLIKLGVNPEVLDRIDEEELTRIKTPLSGA
jgi:hypothetical protein